LRDNNFTQGMSEPAQQAQKHLDTGVSKATGSSIHLPGS
jgi:hypothetical protein